LTLHHTTLRRSALKSLIRNNSSIKRGCRGCRRERGGSAKGRLGEGIVPIPIQQRGVLATPIQPSSLAMLSLLNLTHTTLRDKILGLLRDQRHQEQATRQADHSVTAE
jgi:hypothetical protein